MTAPPPPPPPPHPKARTSGLSNQPTPLGSSGGEADAVRAALSADYEVFEELGRGGMAVVYRAKERALEREVAIKVLPSAMTFEVDVVERFEREARTAGQLEHPNIVPIYRVGRAGPEGKVIFFVMKMLRGQSLSAVLRGRGRLNVTEIRQILEQTASALSFAAKKGVVHRDIKPDNILLDDDGRCIVTDFGIAKTKTGPQTVTGTSMGTPRYMSPEQAQGTPVDARSDIYSLGVVAYECLAGRTPFDADNPFAILYKHINDTVPRPTLTSPEQWEVYGIISKMLGKKAEERYQNADELLVALGVAVSSPTLKAAAPVRISKMTATEMIDTTTLQPWWQQSAFYRKVQSNAARFGVRMWHIGAAAGLILVLTVALTAQAKSRARAAFVADSTRTVIQAKRIADSTALALAAAARKDSIDRARVADSVSKTRLAAAARAKVLATASRKSAPVVREIVSRCPAVGSKGLTRMLKEPALLVDSIVPQIQGDTLRLSYDVCGLAEGTAFTTDVTLRKTRQSGLKRLVGAGQDPVKKSYPDAASGIRMRRTRPVELAVSSGTYEVEVVITDASGKKLTAKREFVLKSKPNAP